MRTSIAMRKRSTCSKIAADRINLPILHDGRLVLSAEVDLEQGVVAGFGTQNRGDLFGVYRERNRFPFAAIKSRGHSACHTQAPCFIFAPCFAGRAFTTI